MKDRKLDLLVDAAELDARRAPPKAEVPERGFAKLYANEILGADEGCDFGFLKPGRAADSAETRIAAE